MLQSRYMHGDITQLSPTDFPELLKEITDPPKKLFIRGTLPSNDMHYVCVVGSRKYSPYGKEACEHLITGLRGYPVVVVSGLALGIDAIAHRTALKARLHTIAVPGSGLSDTALYPKTNIRLAHDIIDAGGCLLSEFEPDFTATPWSFPKRNRIMAGMSHVVLIIEAEEKSGTLITARLGMEYNREVCTVPASVFSSSSRGSNTLLRQGVTAITTSEDILEALHIDCQTIEKSQHKYDDLSDDEQKIVAVLIDKPLAKDELIQHTDLPTHEANILLSALEIKGLIEEKLGKVYLK